MYSQLQGQPLSGIEVTVHERNYHQGTSFIEHWTEAETFPIEHKQDILGSLESVMNYIRNQPLLKFKLPPYEYKLTFHKDQQRPF